MRLLLAGTWLLSVALAGTGGYALARSDDSGTAPTDSAVLARLERQEALLMSLRAQVGAMDLHLTAQARAPVAPVSTALAVPPAAAPVAGTAEEASEDPAREAPTPEQVALVDRGTRMVEAALGARRWRTDDAMALRGMLPQMPRAERDAMLGRLIAAMNDGRIAYEGDGPPF